MLRIILLVLLLYIFAIDASFNRRRLEQPLKELGVKLQPSPGNYSLINLLHKSNHTRKHHRKFIYDATGYQKLLLVAAIEPAHKVVAEIQKRLKIRSFVYNHHLLQSDEGVFMIRITNDRLLNDTIYWFVMHPAVLWVDFHRQHRKHNEDALALAVDNIPHQYFSRNQVISVSDTGLDYRHNYFRSNEPLKVTYDTRNLDELIAKSYDAKNKVRAYVSVTFSDGLETYASDFKDEPNGHGTHVTGTCCGDGSQNNQSSLETHSKIVFFDIGVQGKEYLVIPPLITPLLKLSQAYGSNFMSCSWGSATCMYTFTSMEMDRFMYFNREYLIIVSAGNSGHEPFTVGSPATFKNGISVGASQNTRESFVKSTDQCWDEYKDLVDHEKVLYENYGEENLADFSSRGPTCDGRIKPDVVYPGQFILSSRSGSKPDSMLYDQGTSMSAPGITRIAAMAREILQDKFLLQNPTASLIKNIFITSAKKLTGTSQLLRLTRAGKLTTTTTKTSLDVYDQGFGRATLTPLMNSELEFLDRIPITSFQQWSKYYISDKTYTLNIGLVWTDFPGYMYANKALVNDLNLIIRVINNTGHVRVIYGNHGGELDSLNTVEKVSHRVFLGEKVLVTVEARGSLVSAGRAMEEFSLVWYKGLSPINFTETEHTRQYLPVVLCEDPNQVHYEKKCYPVCNLGNLQGILLNGNCTCINHMPCGIESDGTVHISHCVNGIYQQCLATKPKPISRGKHRSLHQIFAISPNSAQIDIVVYLGMTGVIAVLMIISYFVIC